MRIHCVGVPHVKMTDDYPDCAFTQRLMRFSEMMKGRGHDVFVYGVEGGVPDCTEFIPCLSADDQETLFEDGKLHGDDPSMLGVKKFNLQVIMGLGDRLEDEDIVLLTWGWPQLEVANAFPGHLFIEGAIGYGSRVLPYAVFDTYTWMHYMYGKMGVDQGKFFDAAILGPFNDWQFLSAADHDDYLLFIGRLTPLKGIGIAQDLAEKLGKRLVVCGRGDESLLTSDCVDYKGLVKFDERARLLQGATALIAPTQYIEPGGQVVVEASMAGVPAITTDFGCFVETNNPPFGWRAHTMSEFMIAAVLAGQLTLEDREYIQRCANAKYGYEAVGAQWEDYLLRCSRLFGPGFYG